MFGRKLGIRELWAKQHSCYNVVWMDGWARTNYLFRCQNALSKLWFQHFHKLIGTCESWISNTRDPFLPVAPFRSLAMKCVRVRCMYYIYLSTSEHVIEHETWKTYDRILLPTKQIVDVRQTNVRTCYWHGYTHMLTCSVHNIILKYKHQSTIYLAICLYWSILDI